MSEVSREPEFEDILAKALELRDAGHDTWLEEACGDDAELRAAVSKYATKSERFPGVLKASLTHDGLVGDVLDGRYEITERLGAGAMGVVYRAKDIELDRDVAVKVLRTDMIDPDEAVSRFLREAEVMASIQHPAIITIYDRGHAPNGGPYIVMELLDGVPLSDLLDEGRRREGAAFSDRTDWLEPLVELDERTEKSYVRLVTRWVGQLAAGLEAVHRAGALHRDIKPSNIFIRRDGRPVLLDFGVAAHEGRATLTREGAAVGTPVYMAPESLRSAFKARPTVDVYGLAATLYHMLTLRPPYTGSATQVLASIVSRDPQSASSLRPGLPRDLQAILDKGMDRRPRARYSSALELESDLLAFLEYRAISARPVPPIMRALRRMYRSKLAQGASLTIFVLVLIFAVRGLRNWFLERRVGEYNSVIQQLPPNFTIVSPPSRPYRYDVDRDHVAHLLDRATELSESPLPAFLLRSSFRFDHGDLPGAIEDMSVVARHIDSPLARELHRRYAAVSGEELSTTFISLDDLPEVEVDDDVYLLAYHHLRRSDIVPARECLADPRLETNHHAQELRLAAANFGGLTATEEKELAVRLYTDAIRLEERVGFRSAATAHVISRMLSIQGRYVEALELAREGVGLADRSHTLRLNAGMMAWRLGLDEEAEHHWSVAIDLQPSYFKAYRNLMWLHLDRGELEEVEMLIDRAPLGEGDAAERTRLSYRARVETERAMRANDAGDDEAAAEHAQRAAALLERVNELEPLTDDAYVTINAGLLAEDSQGVFIGLAELLANDPFRWRRLGLLLENMPEDLDASSTQAMRELIQAFHDQLASQRVPLEKVR